MKIINNFKDLEYRFLGNFYQCDIEMDGEIYPSVEHAFQAAKTYNDNDRLRIKSAPSPRHAKRIGRQVLIRHDWDLVKVDIMSSLLEKKFQIPELRKKLLSTCHQEIMSGGDQFWGCQNGVGDNNLGKLLMKLRDDIVSEATKDYEDASRTYLLSCGWHRDASGDIMFNECWVPPWDENCQYNIINAVFEQFKRVCV